MSVHCKMPTLQPATGSHHQRTDRCKPKEHASNNQLYISVFVCKPKEHASNNLLCVFVFDRCEPVYCKYQFFNQPMHTTVAKEHGKNIYWDDKNVVLLGMHLPIVNMWAKHGGNQ